jgi:hypothetical protein
MNEISIHEWKLQFAMSTSTSVGQRIGRVDTLALTSGGEITYLEMVGWLRRPCASTCVGRMVG